VCQPNDKQLQRTVILQHVRAASAALRSRGAHDMSACRR